MNGRIRKTLFSALVTLGAALGVALCMALGALLCAVLGFASPAAAAAKPEILLSSDGVTYAPSLQRPLFSDIGILVPGAVRTATFYVKSEAATDSRLSISMIDVTFDSPAFARTMMMGLETPASAKKPALALASAAHCATLLKEEWVPEGKSVMVTATVAMDDVDQRVAQSTSGTLKLLVSMRDAAAPAPASASPGCEGGVAVPVVPGPNEADGAPGGALSDSGAAFVFPGLALASALLGVGMYVATNGRRRRREREAAGGER